MTVFGKIDPEIGVTYITVESEGREKHDAWVGNLSMDTFLQDMADSSEELMTFIPFIFTVVDPKSGRSFFSEYKLETYTAETFYEYAVDGIPRFMMRKELNGNLRECTPEELKDNDFGTDLTTFLAYNELFTSLKDTIETFEPAYSMIVVLNMFRSRLKLDVSSITGEPLFLTIPEVSLLAGMKEKSVRNLAREQMNAKYNQSLGRTVISAENALRWLKGRRKFVPSQLPQEEASRQYLVKILKDFFWSGA